MARIIARECHLHHPGFARPDFRGILSAAGFDDIEDATAFVHRRNDRDYPVFLTTGRVRQARGDRPGDREPCLRPLMLSVVLVRSVR
jgi:hypothetical protein